MDTLGTSWGNVAFDRREGEGPTLVFLHGTGCDTSDWDGVLSCLGGLDTLTLDFRGHGESAVPDEDFQFADLSKDAGLVLELLGVDNPVVVGHSLGGMVGIDLSTRHALSGLVVLEGWTRLSVVRDAFERGGQRFGRLPAADVGRIIAKRDATLGRFGGDQWRSFWHTVGEFDGYAVLDALEIPVFEVYGTERARPDARERLRIPDRPNIEIQWLDGAGHYLPHEKPREIAEICRRAREACA